ncbi:hypothetical protein CYY_003231 [Polysphondylium violaceum]|uniref:Uncharacterized protein n=1 Tax=Polysphondylium violaceum TaxID=133409 RepID=A0A8J4V0B9_9MYCE|nr:hypothetical protein CYY_003231 [Polysphondylium violaceum]
MNKGSIFYLLLVVLVSIDPISSCYSGRVDLADSAKISDYEFVDWFFIIKVHAFTDVYLYIDSTMNRPVFKTGYFLRSIESPLGNTMDDYNNKEDTHFVHYNDQDYMDGRHGGGFSGSHEKGFIGIDLNSVDDGDNVWRGVWIQHSMPRFPSGVTTDDYNYFVPPLRYALSEEVKKMYYHFGFSPVAAFFHTNLVAKINLGSSEIEEKSIADEITNMVSFINTYRLGDDIYYRAALYDGGTRSQHALCVSISHKENFLQLLEYLSILSNNGIGGTASTGFDKFLRKEGKVFHSGQPGWVNRKPGNDGNVYLTNKMVKDMKYTKSDGSEVSLPTNTYKNQIKSKIFNFGKNPSNPNYLTPNNAEGEGLFYMKINSAAEQKNDVWKTMVVCSPGTDPEPCLKRPAAGGGKTTIEKITVATWVQSEGDKWWNGIFLTPRFSVKGIDFGNGANEHQWDGNTSNEHSKIAWRHVQPLLPNTELWNVCVSGGNLIPSREKDIKSSVLVCFKSDPLRGALNSITNGGAEDVKNIQKLWKPRKKVIGQLTTILNVSKQDEVTLTRRKNSVVNYRESSSDEDDAGYKAPTRDSRKRKRESVDFSKRKKTRREIMAEDDQQANIKQGKALLESLFPLQQYNRATSPYF